MSSRTLSRFSKVYLFEIKSNTTRNREINRERKYDKQTREKKAIILFSVVANIENHQLNVRHSNEIVNIIREKVIGLITKIKEEERKLLENIQEFTNSERR